MKRLLIDGRCLLDTRSGGVRRLVLPFIESLIANKIADTEIVVGFTSHASLPADLKHLPHQHVRIRLFGGWDQPALRNTRQRRRH